MLQPDEKTNAAPAPVRRNTAEIVMQRTPGTCADFLPLVMWQDSLTQNGTETANYHHDFYSLYIIASGKGTHVIDGAAYGIAKGDVYVMGPRMVHYFENGDKLRADTFHFTLAVFDETIQNALRAAPGFRALLVSPDVVPRPSNRRWLHLTPPAYHEIAHAVKELKSEWQTGTVLGAELTRGLFLRLLVSLSRYAAPAKTEQTTDALLPARYADNAAAVAQAVRFMDAHFAGTIRIDELAGRVFLSPDCFGRTFREQMGRTPRDYLKHLRVEKAKTLLKTTNAPLSEVARLSGFGEASYLVRVLKSETGHTPRRFRILFKG